MLNVKLLPVTLSMLAAGMAFGSAARANVPAQYIAKMYTEALGRAPDPTGWNAAVASFTKSGCNQKSLSAWGRGVLASAEFTALGYDNLSATLVLYRAIYNREPDLGGYNAWLTKLNSGITLASAASSFYSSAEFGKLVDQICDHQTYSFGSQGSGLPIQPPISDPAGYSDISEFQLQTLLTQTAPGGTVYLTPRAVIYLDEPLVIPAGVTLTTVGAPGPVHHANMARLVRDLAFTGPLVKLAGTIRGIWIDGERTKASAFVPAATNIEIDGGTGATVDANFIAGSLGAASVTLWGANNALPCGSAFVTNNVITAYAGTHFDAGAAAGIQNGCENGVITGNQVVDASSVGIDVLSAFPAVQKSQITNNVVVAAGNSAFGALALDPLSSAAPREPDFTGSLMANNVLFGGPNSHFIIGVGVGSRAWFKGDLIGTGATVTGNSTGGVPTLFASELVVAGMKNATVENNVFSGKGISLFWTHCPIGGIYASVSAGLASGTIQSYRDQDVDGCMSDFMPHD